MSKSWTLNIRTFFFDYPSIGCWNGKWYFAWYAMIFDLSYLEEFLELNKNKICFEYLQTEKRSFPVSFNASGHSTPHLPTQTYDRIWMFTQMWVLWFFFFVEHFLGGGIVVSNPRRPKTPRKWTFQVKGFPTHVETCKIDNSRQSYSSLKLQIPTVDFHPKAVIKKKRSYISVSAMVQDQIQ